MFLDDLTTTAIRAALGALEIQRFTLAIHDASFPSTVDEDIGRGSPYGKGARALLDFAGQLGFDSLQLGPQGDMSAVNPSPYDGALFTKTAQDIALGTLADDPLWTSLCRAELPALVAGRPDGPATRVQHLYSWHAARQVVTTLHQRFRALDGLPAGRALADRFDAFRARWGQMLATDSLYEALSAEHASDDWRRWPAADASGAVAVVVEAIRSRRAPEIERHLFGQFILDEQHRAFRAAAASSSVALFGDLQIGFSHGDVWSWRHLFRADYLMGAPPSRTNPAGQPWGYPVIDVEGQPQGALALLVARADRMMADCDGLRVDHPHGLVCPWVYAAADPDPAAAVVRGARLRCSPNLADHPALAPIAIPEAQQLSGDPGITRYADDWVRALRDDQVARYGRLFDALMARVRTAGRRDSDIICEVLSTWPYPLRRVMDRYGLGRFCVTQKADLARADDVYRAENASARDWIMVGNHDTPPIWSLADAWHGTATGAERALALSRRLAPRPELQPRLTRWLAADAHHLCHGLFAELFIGPARRISVFFSDLFGLHDIYNRPGVVHPDNWTLRLPPGFIAEYTQKNAAGAAFNVPLALALALMARPDAGADRPALARRLMDSARHLGGGALDSQIVSILNAGLAAAPP
ncbi:MAG: 4-alpha-glucanotransferase [Myxococcales bacterium]|nr:4-alpha-glucanotransferase [Myxococcales bacterium]